MVDLNLEVLLWGYCVHHPLSHLTSWLTVNQKQFILGKREARKEWVCGVIWHKHIYNLWHSTDTEHALKLYQNFTDTWSVFNNTGSAAMSVDYRSIFTYLLWGRWTDAWLRVLVGLWLRSSRISTSRWMSWIDRCTWWSGAVLANAFEWSVGLI